METALHTEPATAQYANFFRVGHNASELVIDFCQSYGSDAEAAATAVVARVIVSPDGARELHRLLGESLEEQARLHARSAQRRVP
jgi:hypothetical protein